MNPLEIEFKTTPNKTNHTSLWQWLLGLTLVRTNPLQGGHVINYQLGRVATRIKILRSRMSKFPRIVAKEFLNHVEIYLISHEKFAWKIETGT